MDVVKIFQRAADDTGKMDDRVQRELQHDEQVKKIFKSGIEL